MLIDVYRKLQIIANFDSTSPFYFFNMVTPNTMYVLAGVRGYVAFSLLQTPPISDKVNSVPPSNGLFIHPVVRQSHGSLITSLT